MLCLHEGQESHFSPTDSISSGPEGPTWIYIDVSTRSFCRWGYEEWRRLEVNSKYVPSCLYSNQQVKWIHRISWSLLKGNYIQHYWREKMQISHTEPSQKYKNKIKDFQKLKQALETLLISYGRVFFTVCRRVTALSKASLTCFFTGDYSKNKTGSQASRAWDLHEAESHLRDQCCHFVDQATQIHHARCISFAK